MGEQIGFLIGLIFQYAHGGVPTHGPNLRLQVHVERPQLIRQIFDGGCRRSSSNGDRTDGESACLTLIGDFYRLRLCHILQIN